MIELVMVKRGCSYDELFEAYVDVCKENKVLQKDFDKLDKDNLELIDKINEQKKQISELESELAVKEDLLKTVANRYDKLLLDSLRVTRIDEDINCGEEPLPFSCDEYTDALFEELEDLRERHQQDCITINQLQTTIDTLVDRYAKLRKMRGV